ncbi:hypothetical protein Tsubulata_049701 [Turnera subulata]|uniref:F-box associated domain-containing protein n=1 Tax=Turnera subulata TaxID=218843 RepID=A0A9Q0F280_9ROSI|nr:hypothetical protein Tsubulata_049701 [Turnera subulata]
MGLLLNGALYWGPREESSRGEKGEINAAISFNLEKEKFFLVPGPPIQISIGFGSSSFGVFGEYLCFCHSYRCKNIIWVKKEYCNEASWVPFISYTFIRVEYVCNFVPRSFKDDRCMMLQFCYDLHVLKWNNNLEESDEAEKYSKKIKYSRALGVPYEQTLASPYAS